MKKLEILVKFFNSNQKNIYKISKKRELWAMMLRCSPSWNRTFLRFLFLLFLLPFSAFSEVQPLVLVYTNDIHDHIRPDYDGRGGLPFVSGFIRSLRNQHQDELLVLDSGDGAEKGDIAAWVSHGRLTFQAMSRIGYDAWAPGNHDHDFGIDGLTEFADLAGSPLLCINLIDEAGKPIFQPSMVVEKNGLKIGLIGMIVPRNEGCLNDEETAIAMALEAERLRPMVDLIVAICHDGVEECARIAEVATEIDIFISGHTHVALEEAYIHEKTGAIIVQAGCYAEYVGIMELEIDVEARELVDFTNALVPMDHDSIPCDVDMVEWFRQEELKLTPEANRIVGWSSQEIGYAQVGILAAEAIRQATGADIGFNASGQVVRGKLPSGIIDLNAVFRTGGERGNELVELTLTGKEIEAYLNGLTLSDWHLTQWSGFTAHHDGKHISTNLDAGRTYRVAMPELEFTSRFSRLFEKVRTNPANFPGIPALNRDITPKRIPQTWTEVVTHLMTGWATQNKSLEEEILMLAQQSGQMTIAQVTRD